MKNKIFPIVCIFLLIVSVFFTNVNASSSKTVTIDNNVYTLPADCTENYCIAEVLYCGDYPFWGVNVSNNDVVIYNFKDNEHIGDFSYRSNFKYYSLKKGSYDFSQVTPVSSNWWVFSAKYAGYEGTKCLYTSNDIKKFDGSIFFQKAPVPVLVEVMKKEKAEKKTIQEILEVLPLTIVVVVSFLGLRKALRMLLNLLKTV